MRMPDRWFAYERTTRDPTRREINWHHFAAIQRYIAQPAVQRLRELRCQRAGPHEPRPPVGESAR
jgi:hypothetical protein